MPISNLFKISQTDRNKFCTHLIESSAPRLDFYFLIILSSLIVVLGLLADNVVLVIGGMLVTPLLSPILAIALGIVINDSRVIKRSVRVFLMSFAFAFLVSLFIGIFTINTNNIENIKLIKIMEPSLFAFFVAVVAGLAASFTWVKPNLNGTLPGISITVTLIPPLTAIGLAVAHRNWIILDNVLKVFLLNIFGIIVTSILVFSLMDFYRSKKTVVEEVKEEEKELQKEKNNNN